MKVYAVVMETDGEVFGLHYRIVGIYKNENDAIEEVADIMQEIEAYEKTEPQEDKYNDDDLFSVEWSKWRNDWPYQINDNPVFTTYLKEFELL